ncbi:MAG: aspartyl-phosphate phosphatase Spo0E family protein [Peptococcaceae bacterium]|nr:aspartyl-phosphate phosphatase Spo0E family protein [Peptococcaceae bacterium]
MEDDIADILAKIEELRERLHRVIEAKGTIADPEVIATSEMLDALLNEYYRLLKQKQGK